MKVFVSWSGSLSQKVACALRDWIPCVLQYVRPYVSSEDIDKGTRWSVDIAKELSDSTYGILCVTSDNQDAPWLNFEAGALSKAIDKLFVSPFLLNLKAAELKNGPLIQFQATAFSHEEVRKLIESINNKSGDGERVELPKRTFDKWWPELEKELSVILQEAPLKSKTSSIPSKQETMIEELLELVRSQQRFMSNPESLLPPQYLAWATRHERQHAPPFRRVLGEKFHETLIELTELIQDMESSELQTRAAKAANRLHHLYHEREDRAYPTTRRAKPALSAANSESSDKK